MRWPRLTPRASEARRKASMLSDPPQQEQQQQQGDRYFRRGGAHGVPEPADEDEPDMRAKREAQMDAPLSMLPGRSPVGSPVGRRAGGGGHGSSSGGMVPGRSPVGSSVGSPVGRRGGSGGHSSGSGGIGSGRRVASPAPAALADDDDAPGTHVQLMHAGAVKRRSSSLERPLPTAPVRWVCAHVRNQRGSCVVQRKVAHST